MHPFRRMAMKKKLLPFDPSELLSSNEAIAAYLTQVLADGDTEELLRAVEHIAKARARKCLPRQARH